MDTAARFPEHERRVLLLTPGLGEGMVAGLEAAGITSLGQLLRLGVDRVVNEVAEGAWRNRRRALARALRAAQVPVSGA